MSGKARQALNHHSEIVLETVLLGSALPLALDELVRVFDYPITRAEVKQLLIGLERRWCSRGVRLCETALGWRFQTKEDYQPFFGRLRPQKVPQYSRTVMETIAVIAYRQPVTRGDIEAVRGVAVTSVVMKTLETRGWIQVVGHRDVPGKPALYTTTRRFLSDLGLKSLQDLPMLEKCQNDVGMLDHVPSETQSPLSEPECEQSYSPGH